MAATYVVDASVAIKRFLQETYTVEARVLFGRMSQGDRLYVPEFCLIECVNVLWTNVRFRGLLQTDAERFTAELLALPFQIVPVKKLLPQALQISLTHQLAIYDSLYIALALRLSCPLITVDARQLNAATACGAVIKPITDFSAEGGRSHHRNQDNGTIGVAANLGMDDDRGFQNRFARTGNGWYGNCTDFTRPFWASSAGRRISHLSHRGAKPRQTPHRPTARRLAN